MKPTDLAKHLTDFLSKYLPGERGMSHNTVITYKDTFILLFNFMKEVREIAINQLKINQITKEIIVEFLEWVQSERSCSVSTRNARLAAIRSFFAYLQYQDLENLYECQKILSIPVKKAEKKAIKYLSLEGIKLLLEQPDRKNKKERRDLAILALMYDTGTRVQEIADLKVGNLRRTSPYTLTITGKGNKTRIVPLLENQI
ncbi:Tyrosine recombinase XerD [termite gut metagenome]|uniref:Tyrosine recombinase XerD n=1 Tax=termite gut metagenome TaxID=433724 RepID=A0A5J4R7Z3_9ZZZZ